MPDVVYILGNGVSMEYAPSYFRLASLTDRVRSEMQHRVVDPLGEPLLSVVESLCSELGADGTGARPSTDGTLVSDNFEKLVGPIQRLPRSMYRLQKMASAAGGNSFDLHRAAEASTLFIDRVATQVVGTVLETVCYPDLHGTPTNSGGMEDIAEHVWATSDAMGGAAVFTLNYDYLLDRFLLDAGGSGHHLSQLADNFDGRQSSRVMFKSEDGFVALARPMRRTSDPWVRDSPLDLLHLHGAASWFKTRPGQYFKMKRDDMRQLGILTSWSRRGECQLKIAGGEWVPVSPVVLLSDYKQWHAKQKPYSRTYRRLERAVASARFVVVAGYGFGDRPLNTVLAEMPAAVQLVVVDPAMTRPMTIRRYRKAVQNRRFHTLATPLSSALVAIDEIFAGARALPAP